jgi:hypothetical protein
MNDPIADTLRTVLNSKGYGFQYSILKYSLQVAQRWRTLVTEYPVDLNDAPVHIDFVLESAGPPSHLLVVECKHAEQWTWGFARGISSRSPWRDEIRADFLSWNLTTNRLERDPHGFRGQIPYNVGVEYHKNHQKHSEEKEQKKQPRAFDQALTQVLHARAGFLNDLFNRRAKQYDRGAVVPAIFTTASLVATETELARSDFKTGRMAESDGVQKTWLWYDDNLTSRLRPSLPPAPRERAVDDADFLLALDRDMTKSVAVVTPDGIEKFLAELPVVLTSFSRDDRI